MIKTVIVISKVLIGNFLNFILSIKLLLFVRFLFGHYHEFSDNIIVKRISILYCILLNTMLPFAVYQFVPSHFVPQTNHIYHYFLILVSICTSERYVLRYVDEIKLTDYKFQLQSGTTETILCKILSGIILGRVCVLFPWIATRIFPEFKSRQFAYMFDVGTQSVGIVSPIFVLELFRSRVRLLRAAMQNCFENDVSFEEGTVSFKLKEIKRFIYIYKQLLVDIEKQFSWIKLVVTAQFVLCFRNIMNVSYTLLQNLIMGNRIQVHYFSIIDNTSLCVITFLPTFLAELAKDEIDKMKTLLAEQLLKSQNADLRSGLRDALTFLRVRAFKIFVWRAVPIDVTAPIAFVALCTDYLIVMLQLKKTF